MRFLLSSFVVSIFASSVLASLHFTNTAFDIVVGKPFLVTWTGALESGPATLTLHDASNKLLFVIASEITGNSYSWTPSQDVLALSKSFFFEIEITIELITSDQVNIQADSTSSSSTISSSSKTSSAPTTTTPSSVTPSASSAPTTSSTTTSTKPSNTTESNIVAHSKLKPGAIGGIFVAVLAVIIGIITLIWFFLRRRRQQRAKEEVSNDLQTPELEGGAATNDGKQDGLKDTISQSQEAEKPELASNSQEPFPVFSNEDPFFRQELSAPLQQQHPINHNQSYEVAATGSVAELDGWRHHNGPDYASPGVSPGELPANSPGSGILGRKPVPSMQQPNAHSPEGTAPRSEFTEHPPWTNDGDLNRYDTVGASPGVGSAGGEGAAGEWDDEVTRLAAEQRRLSAEIADAERVRELKAQKAAVDERLSLLKSKSTGSGAGQASQ